MKKNVGLKNNNNLNNKKTSLILKNKKKLNNELSKKNDLIFKEAQLKREEYQKNNHINKSIDFKNLRNKTKKNNHNKKIKKITNKSSLSMIKEINDSEEQKVSNDFNNPIKYLNNKNKNNSVILTNLENIYTENNILLLSKEKPKNNEIKKYNNGSSFNIRVNKPTRLILDKDISINDCILHLEPQDTKRLKFGEYVYDIQITFANGDVNTFISGKFKLKPEVE